MARSRPFRIHKGAGGLIGLARFVERQSSGENNSASREFLKRSPVQGARVRVIAPRIITPVDPEARSAQSESDVDTGSSKGFGTIIGAVFGATTMESHGEDSAAGSVVGVISGASEMENASPAVVAVGTVVGPIFGASFGGNASMMIAEGTVV